MEAGEAGGLGSAERWAGTRTAEVRRDKSEEVWALKLGRRSGGRTVTELDAENAGDPQTPVLMR